MLQAACVATFRRDPTGCAWLRPHERTLSVITKEHPFFPRFYELMAEAAEHTPVYDLGTSKRFAKEVGLVRELFPNDGYVAGGVAPDPSLGEEACDFECDVQNLHTLADASVGAVLSLSVLEHVEDPDRALAEFRRVLRGGGLCIASVPFLLSYHGKRAAPENPVFDAARVPLVSDNSHGGFGDYWRFTHEGLARLFANAGFRRVDIWPVDGRVISRLELLGLYGKLARLPLVRRCLARIDRPMLGRSTTHHLIRALKG